MSKLHEIIAVENDVEKTAHKAIEEAAGVFGSKHNLFLGWVKRLKWLDADRQDSTPTEPFDETVELTTTVSEKLNFLSGQVAKYWNVLIQKETANQRATADLVLDDGTILIGTAPATFLLGMEKRLKHLRKVYEKIPTLPAGQEWEPDPSAAQEGVYKASEPEQSFKTEKQIMHKVLYEATKEHPAQIEKWASDINVGVFTKHKWSGMVTSREKADMLGRLDELIRCFKKARQRANEVEVDNTELATKILDYINTGK